MDSAPLSSLVADREVAGEDGGWRSNITTTCERQREYSGPETLPKVNPELPIIDLLEDIDDNISFKSEPMSPKIEDLDACLLEDSKSPQKVADHHREDRSDRNQESKLHRIGTYCTFCHKSFSRAWSLQRHLADTHFYVPQSLACDQCGRSYKSRNSLISHKSQYHAKKERKEEMNYLHEVTY